MTLRSVSDQQIPESPAARSTPQLTQQPLISSHVTITPSTPEAVPRPPYTPLSSEDSLAKRPRLSIGEPAPLSTPIMRKPVFTSESAKQMYDKSLVSTRFTLPLSDHSLLFGLLM